MSDISIDLFYQHIFWQIETATSPINLSSHATIIILIPSFLQLSLSCFASYMEYECQKSKRRIVYIFILTYFYPSEAYASFLWTFDSFPSPALVELKWYGKNKQVYTMYYEELFWGSYFCIIIFITIAKVLLKYCISMHIAN